MIEGDFPPSRLVTSEQPGAVAGTMLPWPEYRHTATAGTLPLAPSQHRDIHNSRQSHGRL